MADIQTAAPAKRTRKPATQKAGTSKAPAKTGQRQSKAKGDETKKPAAAAVTSNEGGQTQAAPKRTRAKAADATAPKATRKKATQPAGTGRGRGNGQQQSMPLSQALEQSRGHLGGKGSAQQSDAEPQGSQGATASGKGNGKDGAAQTQTEAMRGGTKQVLIEYTKMGPRIDTRERQPEEYPFGDLPPAKKVNGEIEGPSFFIPDSDKAKDKLAAGRKRHKPTTFWTRREMAQVNGRGPKVMGIRIWKAPAGAK